MGTWENELTDSLSVMLKCPISRFRRENEHEYVSLGTNLTAEVSKIRQNHFETSKDVASWKNYKIK